MRLMWLSRSMAARATTIMMVVQLGLAMMPRGRVSASSGFTSGTAVVDHHGSMACDGLSKLLRSAAACTDKGYVNAFEVVVVLQKLYFYLFSTESICGSCTAG